MVANTIWTRKQYSTRLTSVWVKFPQKCFFLLLRRCKSSGYHGRLGSHISVGVIVYMDCVHLVCTTRSNDRNWFSALGMSRHFFIWRQVSFDAKYFRFFWGSGVNNEEFNFLCTSLASLLASQFESLFYSLGILNKQIFVSWVFCRLKLREK